MNRFSRRWLAWFFLVAIWCVLGCVQVASAAGSDAFVSGNAKYAAGDFSGAATAYESQVKTGEFSANLFYNLGNAYYRAGNRGRAVLNYRRALSLEPAHAEAAGNLAFVNGGKFETTDLNGSGPVWNVVAAGASVCGWLGAAGLLVAWWSQRLRAFGRALAVGGFLLCAVGTTATGFLAGNGGGETSAVVLNEATPALYSPVEGAKAVTNLPLGSEVHLLSEQGAWSYVLLPDGRTRAWLSSRAVEPLVPR